VKKSVIIAALMLFSGISSASSEKFTISGGLDYDPIAKLEYPNTYQATQEIVDNVYWEVGLFYNMPTGFRVGTIFDFYGKSFNRIYSGKTDLSSIGIGILGDFAFDITESGRTKLLGAMETGYSNLKDKNEFNSQSAGALWVAGYGGVRYFFRSRLYMEMDLRAKWQRFDFSGVPGKIYDFSGTTLRLAVGYSFFERKL